MTRKSLALGARTMLLTAVLLGALAAETEGIFAPVPLKGKEWDTSLRPRDQDGLSDVESLLLKK